MNIVRERSFREDGVPCCDFLTYSKHYSSNIYVWVLSLIIRIQSQCVKVSEVYSILSLAEKHVQQELTPSEFKMIGYNKKKKISYYSQQKGGLIQVIAQLDSRAINGF